jgi:acetylornithine deacetylase/succinyl-diaminopimelate desuccinylase-like protein
MRSKAIMPEVPTGDEAVDLMSELIRNACVNTGDPASGHEIRSVRTIQAYLDEEGTVIEPIEGRASVVYRCAGRDPAAPTLLLIPHLDVVPANAPDWTYDPYSAERAGGFVWGRGCVDMLNVTASMVVVYKWLRDGIMPPPEGDVILACVADEEAGGAYGAQHLVDNHWDLVACDYVLTEVAGPTIGTANDPSLPVTVAEKGPSWRAASATGKAGHGSQPYARSNAVLTLTDAFSRIGSAEQPIGITKEWVEFVPHLGLATDVSEMLIDPDRIDQAIETLSETDQTLARWIHACTHMTFSPNVIRGGTKANMVPDAASGDVDIRLLPGQAASDVEDHLRKVLGPDLFEDVTFTPVLNMEANSSPAQGPMWDAIADAAEQHLDTRRLAPTLTPVTTDARFFRARGIPSYGVGLFDSSVSFPEMLAMFHGVDERVSEQSVRATTRFLASVVTAFSLRVAGS